MLTQLFPFQEEMLVTSWAHDKDVKNSFSESIYTEQYSLRQHSPSVIIQNPVNVCTYSSDTTGSDISKTLVGIKQQAMTRLSLQELRCYKCAETETQAGTVESNCGSRA